MLLWLTGSNWHMVISQMFFMMPGMLSIPLSNPHDTFLASVPERERWRTYHRFMVFWVALATSWTVFTGASGRLPIAAAASAIVSRVIAASVQHRRERRAVRE